MEDPVKMFNDQLKDFVQINTKGRDESHGWRHMEEVAMISKSIADEMKFPSLHVITVAWLHDVADDKYDKDGSLKKVLEEMVYEVFEFHAKEILQCIDAISYSKEKKKGMCYYEKELEDSYWITVRNIVSDADKLTALGGLGINRCVQYSIHKIKEKKGKTHINPLDKDYKEVWKNVIDHCVDKLLLLPAYLRTEPGKRMGKIKYVETINTITNLGLWNLLEK